MSSDGSAHGGGRVAALPASAKAKVEDGSECWFLFRARSGAGTGPRPTSPGRPGVPILECSPEGDPLRLCWIFRPVPRRECARFSSRHTSIRSALFAPSPPVLDIPEDELGARPRSRGVRAQSAGGRVGRRSVGEDAISWRRSRRSQNQVGGRPLLARDKRRGLIVRRQPRGLTLLRRFDSRWRSEKIRSAHLHAFKSHRSQYRGKLSP